MVAENDRAKLPAAGLVKEATGVIRVEARAARARRRTADMLKVKGFGLSEKGLFWKGIQSIN